MEMLFLLFIFVWSENNGALAKPECGSVVNNTLTSPGYPNHYPENMDCSYWLPIPNGMALIIVFEDFDLENESSCEYDYLKISNEKSQSFGVYCGNKIGEMVAVTGDYAVITFHSDGGLEKRGFRIFFQRENGSNAKTIVSPKVVSSAPTVQAFRPDRGFILSCSAIGISPINIVIIWNSKTLVNETNTASIRVDKEGKYICRATSKYGADERLFVVINGCGSVVNNTLTSPGYPKYYPEDMDCSYWVPIPHGMALVITFEDFNLENESSCEYDYLKITNEKSQSFGVYCGNKTRELVAVTGDHAVMTFHSNHNVQTRGFRILFQIRKNGSNAKTIVSPKVVMLPAPIMRVIRQHLGFRLSCSAIGISPINMVIIRNSKTLVNTTNTASVQVEKFGNYMCRATSKYGTDERQFVVINACPKPCDCALFWRDKSLVTVSCGGKQLTSVPEPLPANTAELDLSDNSLNHLPAGIFSNNTKLEDLDLSDNSLNHLPAGIFSNNTKLEDL